ncbi:hypothetical protein RV134_210139 [Roseovarius sp. EC-HK134]|nr:hypothetical protein RV134_210139 [Roseovarius sp. EC-HK134]VVT01470.1 hypothetical protein RV420_260004 [Roseovarius sp. EC-SD190]
MGAHTGNERDAEMRIFGYPTVSMARHRAAALFVTLLLAGCGTSSPQINPTTQLSNDPILNSVYAVFEDVCINSAPGFREYQMSAAFRRSQLLLASGMSFIGSSEDGQRCRVTIQNYGAGRPKPTVGDINRMGRLLQAHLGGTFSPKSADAGAGSAKVSANGQIYNVFAFVGTDGALTLSVFGSKGIRPLLGGSGQNMGQRSLYQAAAQADRGSGPKG